jgi:hypothetical protein
MIHMMVLLFIECGHWLYLIDGILLLFLANYLLFALMQHYQKNNTEETQPYASDNNKIA